jgi:hypothetical protein
MLDGSCEKENEFLNMLERSLGRNQYSKKFTLFSDVVRIYDKLAPEHKSQINSQLIALNKYPDYLQQVAAEQPSVKYKALFNAANDNAPRPHRPLNLGAVSNATPASRPMAYRLNLFPNHIGLRTQEKVNSTIIPAKR